MLKFVGALTALALLAACETPTTTVTVEHPEPNPIASVAAVLAPYAVRQGLVPAGLLRTGCDIAPTLIASGAFNVRNDLAIVIATECARAVAESD
jgi:hypothetical protein